MNNLTEEQLKSYNKIFIVEEYKDTTNFIKKYVLLNTSKEPNRRDFETSDLILEFKNGELHIIKNRHSGAMGIVELESDTMAKLLLTK